MSTLPDRPPRPMWQIVLGLVGGVLLLVAAAFLLPWLMPPSREGASAATEQLPWQIQSRPDGGTQVFGLRLGGATPSRLEEAQALWPQEVMKVALLSSRAGHLALEAYLESVRVGGLQGKLVLAAQADPAHLAAWARRSLRGEILPSGARQASLHADDLAEARRSVLGGVVFLPATRLDEATVQQRFGTPAQRLATADGAVHLLYPDRGLAITLATEGRERPVLQYVAPADFQQRLRAPLDAAASAPPAASAP